jgi:DNA-binding transcriptional LysR family regulator
VKLNFRELEVVWAILAEGSVSGASRRLSVTQPAVSMMLRQAESRLGFALFDRSGQGLSPSAELRELAPQLGAVFSQLRELGTQIVRVRDGQIGMIRIATTAALAESFVVDALTEFHSRYPNVAISLQLLSSAAVIDEVEGGRVDIGISYNMTSVDGVARRLIGTTDLVCATRHGGPLSDRQNVSPEDVAGLRLISYRPGAIFGRKLQACFEAHGLQYAPAIETNARTAALLAANGVGIGLVDALAARNVADDRLRICGFTPRVSAPVYVFRPGTGSGSAFASDLDEIVGACFAMLDGPYQRSLEVRTEEF